MSRKGKVPIQIPAGVEVKLTNTGLTVKGPKGTLEQNYPKKTIDIKLENQQIHVMLNENSEQSNLHGLYRTLFDNMINGVTKGFEKKLELIGVGYRAQVQGSNLNLTLGHSHPILMPIPSWAKVTVEKNFLTIAGMDKQKVGEFAALIRKKRAPEPYKGKGVRYQGEFVRKKAGKAAAKK
jgi:large subunit ribosomal protein L6